MDLEAEKSLEELGQRRLQEYQRAVRRARFRNWLWREFGFILVIIIVGMTVGLLILLLRNSAR